MKKIFTLFSLSIVLNLHAQTPPGCSSTNDVAGNAGQAGLYGEYFAGYFNDATSFFPNSISSTNRIESNLNYTTNNWGIPIPPASGSAADQDLYSARYRGSIYIATAATYTFYLTSDDASYMWIDNDALTYPTVVGSALINDGGAHGNTTISAFVTLSAGFHNIQIQYGENGGGNNLIFEYASPSISRQVVPNSVLCTGIQPALIVAGPTPPAGCNCSAGVTSEFFTGYYNDDQTYFTSNSSVINRLDPSIAFTTDGGWGAVSPPISGSNANPDLFSTRFTGEFYIPTATTYTFYLTSDDASAMWIDANALATTPTIGTAFINNSGLHSAATISAVATLSVGLHDFRIHYGENTGDNVCYLEYASSTISRQIIPQAAYCSCLSTVNSTLPVELLNFTAELDAYKNVVLKWQTETETNNKQFDVERSGDGTNFNSIGSLPSQGVDGNSLTTKQYQLIDFAPLKGISYYRLRQTDFNGAYKVYKIISLNDEDVNKGNAVIFKVLPNPNNGNFSFYIDGLNAKSKAEINVYSLDGKLLYQAGIDNSLLVSGKITLNANLGLAPGIYIANCVVDGVKTPLKVIVK